MKFFSVLTSVALGVASLNAIAGLPQVFTAEGDTARVKADALSRAYITPTRVVLTEGGVTDPELLLIPGSGQTDIFNSGMCQLSTVNDSVASIVLDFGRELHGSLRLLISAVSPLKTPHMRLRFGESVAEACSELTTAEISVAEDFNNSEVDLKANTATNDHAIRDMVLTLPFYGQYETGNTGYRFVRIDLLDPGMTVNLKEATAILRYRDLPYKGSFKSSDPKLNKIWDTGAYSHITASVMVCGTDSTFFLFIRHFNLNTAHSSRSLFVEHLNYILNFHLLLLFFLQRNFIHIL